MSLKQEYDIDPVDNLPAMIVGRWVTEEKHEIINRYINASHAARAKFSTRTYIDLFSGAGRVKVKHINHYADGGPIAAWNMAKAKKGAFTHFYIADASPVFLSACKTRLTKVGAPGTFFTGVADETVNQVIKTIPSSGLHLAFLDPFNAGHLHFSIIEKLASLNNIDIVVHLSTGDIRRNIQMELSGKRSSLDNVAPGWKSSMPKNPSHREMVQYFIQHWENLVKQTGLRVCNTKYAVKNSRNSTMYHLCMLTRHKLADKLWSAACEISPTRSLL